MVLHQRLRFTLREGNRGRVLTNRGANVDRGVDDENLRFCDASLMCRYVDRVRALAVVWRRGAASRFALFAGTRTSQECAAEADGLDLAQQKAGKS
jgi:uncharacterized membrane protein